MVIAIFGENCVGKSAIADELARQRSATVYAGKDYLRLDKSPDNAKAAFVSLLRAGAESEDWLVYVASEPEQLALLPEGCLRVLVTAELGVIQARFAARMGGNLPPPVAAMLERKHGMFDNAPRDLLLEDGEHTPAEAAEIVARAALEQRGG